MGDGPDHPLIELLTQKCIDIHAIREFLEYWKFRDPPIDLNLAVSPKKNLPPPLFYAIGVRSPGLTKLLIAFRADVMKRYDCARMWNGMRKGMTPLEAVNDRYLHFKGTVLAQRYEDIVAIIRTEEDRLVRKSK